MFKRIVAPPTLPEEAPEDDDDDDNEQFYDADSDSEESSDDSDEEFDKQVCNPDRMSILPFRHYLISGSWWQDNTHSDADEQEEMDLGPELIKRVKDDIERKLQSVGNMGDMEVMFIVWIDTLNEWKLKSMFVIITKVLRRCAKDILDIFLTSS